VDPEAVSLEKDRLRGVGTEGALHVPAVRPSHRPQSEPHPSPHWLSRRPGDLTATAIGTVGSRLRVRVRRVVPRGGRRAMALLMLRHGSGTVKVQAAVARRGGAERVVVVNSVLVQEETDPGRADRSGLRRLGGLPDLLDQALLPRPSQKKLSLGAFPYERSAS
jgi:hypothetical protein